MQMLAGIGIIIFAYFAARQFQLLTLYWILNTFLSSIFLIIIIIFQRDIRRALTQVGQTPFSKSFEDTVHSMDEIVGAAIFMARKRIGSLIIMERETGLKDYVESGHPIDSLISRELLVSLFITSSPLHDGGVVIRQGRILTAGCVLPDQKSIHQQKTWHQTSGSHRHFRRNRCSDNCRFGRNRPYFSGPARCNNLRP